MNTRISRTRPPEQTLAEASDWFVTFRFDDADAAARERFGEWLRRSPEHIQAYLEIAGVWSELPHGDPNGRIDIAALIKQAQAPSADIVRLARADTSEQSTRPGFRHAGPRHASRSRAVLAASIFLVLTLPLALLWLGRQGRTYATEVGEQRSITLSDGSVVELNARSRIAVRFSENERDVELVAGQARFKVAHDKARAFKVTVGNGTVTAVGTEFDVYRKANNTLVTVLEGRVAVNLDSSGASESSAATSSDAPPTPPAAPGATATATAPGDLLYLTAGEQAIVTAQAAAKPPHADVQAATAWTEKKMVFDSTPLAEVADEFNRYNTRRLVVTDAQLAALGISGVYSSTDPASLLRFLRDLPNIAVVESPREIRITRKSP
jgi:transmembrane sensor